MTEFIKLPIKKLEILISRTMEIRNNLLERALIELKREYIDREYLKEILLKAIDAMFETDKSFMAAISMLKNSESPATKTTIHHTIDEKEDENSDPPKIKNKIKEKLESLKENNPATYDYLKYVFEKGGKGFTSDFKHELGLHIQTIYGHERILEENGLLTTSKRNKKGGKRKYRYVTIPEEVFIVLESLHTVMA
jgi:hypothetical protein